MTLSIEVLPAPFGPMIADLALPDIQRHVGDRLHPAEGERDVLDREDRLAGRDLVAGRRSHAAFSMAAGSAGWVFTSRTATRAASLPLRPSSNVTSVATSATFEPS